MTNEEIRARLNAHHCVICADPGIVLCGRCKDVLSQWAGETAREMRKPLLVPLPMVLGMMAP
jgi:hypothetical protein